MERSLYKSSTTSLRALGGRYFRTFVGTYSTSRPREAGKAWLPFPRVPDKGATTNRWLRKRRRAEKAVFLGCASWKKKEPLVAMKSYGSIRIVDLPAIFLFSGLLSMFLHSVSSESRHPSKRWGWSGDQPHPGSSSQVSGGEVTVLLLGINWNSLLRCASKEFPALGIYPATSSLLLSKNNYFLL